MKPVPGRTQKLSALAASPRELPAYQEFMNTKRLHDKNDGRMFYHMIQSFKPEEILTPQTDHEIALKMAEQFPGFEILVATHTDREHIHSHFIINSVNADTGKKYHSNLESLQQLREVSDRLCLAYGLSVIQPKHCKTPGMSAREYRSADKGQSWKLQLAITIEDAMTMARKEAVHMTSKVIEYDLRSPGRNYDDLYTVIKGYGKWARLTESTWFIKTDATCAQVRDKLLSVMDANDRLFVGELDGCAAWHNTICSSEYLRNNL